jgi:hypothetical protein
MGMAGISRRWAKARRREDSGGGKGGEEDRECVCASLHARVFVREREREDGIAF